MKRVLLILAVIFLILCCLVFVFYRALNFSPASLIKNEKNKEVEIINSSVNNLSNILKHKVVTTKDLMKNDYSTHDALWAYLRNVYPEVFSTLKVEKIAGYNYLLKWEGTDKKLLPVMFTGHYDTVDVEEKTLKDWKYKPFEGKIAEEKIWGRGALDDRSSFVALFESINLLIKQNYKPKRDIYFAFGHDEETGGINGAVQIAKYLENKNIKFEMILDEGGRVEKKDGRQRAYVGISEKGRLLANIRVENKAMHASRPYSETSITQLAKVIQVLNKHQMKAKLTPQAHEYFKQVYFDRDFITRILIANQDFLKPFLFKRLSKDNLDNTLIRTTTAFTMLQGSNSANAVPQLAQVTVDFRILPTDTPKDVEDHIKKVLSKKMPNLKYSIEVVSAQAPSKVSKIDSKVYGILESEIRNFFPSASVIPYLVPAGTDARNYKKLSDCIYRFLPISLTSFLELATPISIPSL